MDTKNLATLYDLPPIPWDRVRDALEGFAGGPSQSTFLATTRPDGRPHLAGVGAVWQDGKVYVVSGDGTRKSQNLMDQPSCAVSMALPGLDLVIEGRARRVTDQATLQRLADRYGREGWPARVEGGAFTHDYSAPSAGPPPWALWEISPTTIFGVLSEAPGGATRWHFEEGEQVPSSARA